MADEVIAAKGRRDRELQLQIGPHRWGVHSGKGERHKEVLEPCSERVRLPCFNKQGEVLVREPLELRKARRGGEGG
jgi:hypothetical protein